MFIKTLACLAGVGLLLAAASRPAAAQERQFPEANCAITVPADWHALTNTQAQPGVLAGYADPSNNRIIVLSADTNDKSAGPLDERFVKSFEQGFQNKAGGGRISGKFTDIAGQKAYERVGTVPVKGKLAYTLTRVVLVDGAFYSLQGLRLDGDIREDKVTLDALNSFRFLRSPAKGSGAAGTGYPTGKVVFLGGVFIGACLVIGVLLWKQKKAAAAPRA